MSNFIGYAAIMYHKDDEYVFEFTKEKWDDQDHLRPLNPLAAVGAVLSRVPNGPYLDFAHGIGEIEVWKIGDEERETYDCDRMLHELDLERIAG